MSRRKNNDKFNLIGHTLCVTRRNSVSSISGYEEVPHPPVSDENGEDTN